MAEASNDEQAPPQASGGMMKKLMMGVGALVILGAGIAAGPAVMKAISGGDPDAEGATEESEPAGDGPPLYTSLHPPLVVNFKDSLGDTHFMQITMEVMSRDQTVINAVREHTPVIRNNLILLYGNARYEEVTTREGKEAMLQDGLVEIQDIMQEQIGEPGVEAVYFTALVIQ